MWDMSVMVPLVMAGCIAGLLAGLLGLGGGILVVPILVTLLLHTHPDVDIQHIAVGTSFAIMVFTSLSSAITHARLKNVDWPIFRQMGVGVIVGTVLGTWLAGYAPERWLRIFFVAFIFTMSALTFLKAFKETPDEEKGPVNRNPKRHVAAGGFIGVVSSWLGIGGGGMTVPYLILNGLKTHHSVGTAAVVCWPVAVAGALGYMISGLRHSDLGVSDGFLGYVYLPGLLVMAICTVIFAPIGAKISTNIAPKALTITMAFAFLVIGLNMLHHLAS